jgi:hypothetical protein
MRVDAPKIRRSSPAAFRDARVHASQPRVDAFRDAPVHASQPRADTLRNARVHASQPRADTLRNARVHASQPRADASAARASTPRNRVRRLRNARVRARLRKARVDGSATAAYGEQMTSGVVVFDEDGDVRAWLIAAGLAETMAAADADVIACSLARVREAEAAAAARAAPEGIPIVLCLAAARGMQLVAPAAIAAVAVRASAYASDPSSLAAAVRYARFDSSAARRHGDLRLTYLGSLGEPRPRDAPQIGESVRIGASLFIGRGDEGICLRQGAHSDQNTVARRHARIEPLTGVADRVRVTDCQSTNGTWIAGARIDVAELRSGDELAIAWSHRFRLDGGHVADSIG